MRGPTSYPQGVLSWGVPAAGIPFMRGNGGNHWFVQANYGNNGNQGNSPNFPLSTMARAFQLCQSGDTIHFTGAIREQLTAPAGIFDITIIGEGNRPRHADAHTSESLTTLGGRSAATWRGPASPTATTPLLIVRQQGWRFFNILFAPPSDDAALEFIRDAASGDDERDSSHAHICGCRFAGGQDGILISGTENVFNLLIEGNIFNDQTGISIKGTVAGYRHQILQNVFETNAQHIVGGMTQANIWGNVFGAKSGSKFIDLNGGGANQVTFNKLSGTYSIAGGYRAGTGDDWSGNFNSLSGGVTAANPA